MPYRERPEREYPTQVRRTALVEDLVRQFASPYAFARELVQNSIDAGATRIDVTLHHERERGIATFRDDGSGMSPKTVEDRLLILFASGKVGGTTTIGRYGVGFASVFALEPTQVWVHTTDGASLSDVEIRPDHSYDLVTRAGAPPSGTSVALSFEWTEAEFAQHEREIRASLTHWCRHVSLPLEVEVKTEAGSTVHRIDEPISVPGIASIVRTIDGDDYALALARGTAAQAGFYNRGLLLSQLSPHAVVGLDGVNFKVSSPRLGHTLSRDDVLRDAAFRHVLDVAGRLASGDLMDALARAIDAEAVRIATALESGQGSPPIETYVELVAAAISCGDRFAHSRVRVPLIKPWQDEKTIAVGDVELLGGRVHAARVNNAFARSLELDEPVLFVPKQLSAPLGDVLPQGRLRWVHDGFVRRTDVKPENADQLALLVELGKCLRTAGYPVKSVEFSRFDGHRLGAFALSIPARASIAEYSEVRAWAARIEPDDTLFLDVEHDVTLLALAKARGRNVRRVAALLARLLILEHAGAPSVRASDGLLGYSIMGEA